MGRIDNKSNVDVVCRGLAVISAALKTMPRSPGVYRMLNVTGVALYIGKARDLKKRISAYTRPERVSLRIRRMISETANVEVITTHTEAEALLLEADLIKSLAPRYNILLRDDKSFPEIMVTTDHDYPRILKHRGSRKRGAEYFGPFASTWAVNQTLNTLQRAFLLRSCSDSVFSSRTRPCLLFQIKRCCAPCVGKVGHKDYMALIEQARAFFIGRSRKIRKKLAICMQEASHAMAFEEAAVYRDRLRALSTVQTHHEGVNPASVQEADVLAIYQEGGRTCIQVFFFRAGRNHGNRAYFPLHAKIDSVEAVLEAFLGQFYTSHQPPRLLLLDRSLPNQDLVETALCLKAKRKIKLHIPMRGNKHRIVLYAQRNAREALLRRLSENSLQRKLLRELAKVLSLENIPERIEVYDNSHIHGTDQIGAMIVAGSEGFLKKAYRTFNIKSNIQPGDDYAMMHEVLTRRFSHALRENLSQSQWPNLVIVDGGSGQLKVAHQVFVDLGIEDVSVCGISKGPDRHAGREKIYLPNRAKPIILETRDPVLHFIQRLRDEAHRFAISAHRRKRSNAISRSVLGEIPGIGAKRKKALLHHFGSAHTVAQAGLSDLEQVVGISTSIAHKIYDWFHPSE